MTETFLPSVPNTRCGGLMFRLYLDPAMKCPTFKGLKPSCERASAAGRGSSLKGNTKPELLVRHELWKKGLRYRKNVSGLPGVPDLVFSRARVAVFCDGDFWHGKDWIIRKPKLARGNNSRYWIAKIERNMERDGENNLLLQKNGWVVLRFWESEIRNNLSGVIDSIVSSLRREKY